jgi:dinuclear metal center YbgI/SA1388 family protein
MKVADVAATMERMVPLELAQDWDNVGLLIGDPQNTVKNILLTIDITNDVLSEALKQKTDLIVSYHPVIWDGLKKITAPGPPVKPGAKYLAPRSTRGLVYELIRSGIAVFSMHTALDSAAGGVNDGLAEIVGLRDTKPIGDYVDLPAGTTYRLVVFVPVNAVTTVAEAVFAAGAGAMGNYSKCSFQSTGTGTFLPLPGAKPAIGKRGNFESVPEMRFETVVPADKLETVIAALREAHPYETPAFDVLKLHNEQDKVGLGRIGRLAQPSLVKQIIARLKRHTGAKAIGVVGKHDRLVKTAAVCAGSCGKIIDAVIAAEVDLYVTGELKHHYALAAEQAGVTCLCLSHTVSERFILRKLARELRKHLKAVTIKISKKDKDPFKWKSI